MTLEDDLLGYDHRQTQFKKNFKKGDYIVKYNRLAKVIQVFDNPPRVYFKYEHNNSIGFIVPSSQYNADGYSVLKQKKEERRKAHQEAVQNAIKYRASTSNSSGNSGNHNCSKQKGKEEVDTSYPSYWSNQEVRDVDMNTLYSRAKLLERKRLSKKAAGSLTDDTYGGEESSGPRRTKYEAIDFGEYDAKIISPREFDRLAEINTNNKLLRQLQRQENAEKELRRQIKTAKHGFIIDDSDLKDSLRSYLKVEAPRIDNDDDEDNGARQSKKSNDSSQSSSLSSSNASNSDVAIALLHYQCYLDQLQLGPQQSAPSEVSDCYTDLSDDSSSSGYYGGGYLNDDDDDAYEEEERERTFTKEEENEWEEIKMANNFYDSEDYQEEYNRMLSLFQNGYIPKKVAVVCATLR
ncbi:hypothetical protein SAMD00019534_043430 [Acytostelium subglobosum LB1]|uniref:hypothetical protein n=1 Tax=Acytostelium subglobosum LB1 TaxID=1410327 RepID=UPI0006450868|nr:hypothetical protein SAMD00019534_043430 [Acytostelium subglobosum LB1]GAM21168.1 hypothetical protein SAMD00019534_043430 [Acytostelium subglobosum LB1]|eukprot:XP_012756302.1 hypothetical protein SAMD00019534_043430 [Acytostelium subglobosum LB1]